MEHINNKIVAATVCHLQNIINASDLVGDYNTGFIDGINFAISTIKDMEKIEEEYLADWILSDNQIESEIENDNYLYECSFCGHSDLHSKSVEVPYCWYCGLHMKLKQNK